MSVAAGGNVISWNIVNLNVSADLAVKEKKLTRKITGFAKHLTHFPPESLYLQVVLEKLKKKHSFAVRMTLRLPSNILHAEKSHEHLLVAICSAAAALENEVKSLKAERRSDCRWKRPTYRARLAEEALVFSEPMETGTGPLPSFLLEGLVIKVREHPHKMPIQRLSLTGKVFRKTKGHQLFFSVHFAESRGSK